MRKNMLKKKLDNLDDLLRAAGLSLDDDSEKGLPDPELLMFYKNLANREIWLESEISIDTLELNKLILNFNKMDAGIPVEERKPIKIYIYSYGGDASACFSIIDAIEMSKTPVYTYNVGVAMSAAFLILIAGHKRFCTKNSTALVHSGSGSTQGTYEQTEAQMKDYKHTIDVMREYVLKKTKIDQKKFNKNKSTEWYMYSNEQLEFGVVDKVLESADEL